MVFQNLNLMRVEIDLIVVIFYYMEVFFRLYHRKVSKSFVNAKKSEIYNEKWKYDHKGVEKMRRYPIPRKPLRKQIGSLV